MMAEKKLRESMRESRLLEAIHSHHPKITYMGLSIN